jgi:hypothetical protein
MEIRSSIPAFHAPNVPSNANFGVTQKRPTKSTLQRLVRSAHGLANALAPRTIQNHHLLTSVWRRIAPPSGLLPPTSRCTILPSQVLPPEMMRPKTKAHPSMTASKSSTPTHYPSELSHRMRLLQRLQNRSQTTRMEHGRLQCNRLLMVGIA